MTPSTGAVARTTIAFADLFWMMTGRIAGPVLHI